MNGAKVLGVGAEVPESDLSQPAVHPDFEHLRWFELLAVCVS